MMSRRWYFIAALLFLALVVWRLPAAWLTHFLPPRIACEDATGTIWSGRCGRVTALNYSVQDASWTVLGAELRHGKLGLRVSVGDPRLQSTAKVLLARGNRWQVYDFSADLALPNSLLPGVPPDFSGRLQLRAPTATGANNDLETLQATLQVLELRSLRPELALGGYEVRLQTAAQRNTLAGTVRELAGPLRVQGTVTVKLNGDYEANGKVAATAAAAPELVALVERLGPPDAAGMRSFSVAGTR